MPFRVLLIGAIVLLPLPIAGASKQEAVHVIGRVADVRQMTPSGAARGAPVQLRGVVTALSGWKNSFFFQDPSGGISVDRRDQSDLHVGDEVEIAGVTGPGLFAPTVQADHVQVLGRGKLPTARKSRYGDLAEGKLDSQWVEIQGIVHSAQVAESWGRDVLFLTINLDGQIITARVHDFPRQAFSDFVDTDVRVRGVAGTDFNEKRQFVGVRLFVPDLSYIEVKEHPPSDPFDIPASDVQSFSRFGTGYSSSHRVKVVGTVIYQIPGLKLYLQSGETAIAVQTSQAPVVEPGSRVEAVGFLATGERSPALQDAVVRVIGKGNTLAPVHVSAANLIQNKDGFSFAPYNDQLIQLEGDVIKEFHHSGNQVWLVKQGGSVFEAELDQGEADDNPADVPDRSRVRLTGICLVVTSQDGERQLFRVLLRSSRDITVLSRPLWTPGRVIGLLGFLLLATCVWTLAVMMRTRPPRRASLPEPAYSGVLRTYQRLSQAAGLIGGCVGLVVLLGGWGCNVAILRSVAPGYPDMRPNAALALLLSGAALSLMGRRGAGKSNRAAVQVCAGIAALIGILTLVEDVAGWNLHIDNVLFPAQMATLAYGRMAITAALGFTLLGCALLFSYQRLGCWISQSLAAVVSAFCLFNAIGYLFGMKSFYNLTLHMSGASTRMALPTTFTLLLLSCGICLACPHRGLMATITRDAPGGVIVRGLLPAAVLIPVVLGWLRWQGQLRGLYGTAMGLTLFASSNIILFAVLIWISGWLLNHSDLERSRARNDVRKRERQFHQLAEAMPQIVWTARPDGYPDYYNQRWYDFTGTSGDVEGDATRRAILHPDDLERWNDTWSAALRTGRPYEIEYRFWDRATSIFRWYLGRAVSLRDEQGGIIQWVGTCTDIDQQKRLNEDLENRVDARTAELKLSLLEKTTLLQEVHHRVKNNLQVISSLINMQMRKLRDPASRNALEECQSRVLAIALIHEKLYQSKDYGRVPFADYARSLAAGIFHAAGVSPGTVELSLVFENLSLPVDKAIPCGLILNELISNALKHAFPNESRGTLKIQMRGAPGGEFELVVADNGVGIDAGFDAATSVSLGMRLVSTLVKQLEGRLQILREAGTTIRISFPLEMTE